MNLKQAKSEMDKTQKSREGLMGSKREIVILCSKAIRDIHTYNYAAAKEKLKGIESEIARIEKVLKSNPEMKKRLLGICYQEYVELKVLLGVIDNGKLPELKVPPEHYILGVLDAIGELKRRAMDLILKGETDKAMKLYDTMEAIYFEIEGLAYPGSLVPGLKPKQDAMKRVLESLYVTLVEAKIRGKR
jgi:translin